MAKLPHGIEAKSERPPKPECKWKRGDVREDGYVLEGVYWRDELGRWHQKWYSPTVWAARQEFRARYKLSSTASARSMFDRARHRAREFGLPFGIKPSDIVIPETCPVLGIKLVKNPVHSGDSSPSLDRIVPSLGYVPGNVVVISNRANRFKSDGTIEEIGLVYRFYKNLIKERSK